MAFPAPPAAYTPRHARRPHVWRRVVLVVSVVLVLVVGLGTAAFLRLNSNITSVDVTKQLGLRPNVVATPKKNERALNILLIGSDTRAGADSRFGSGISGARSDTTILLHLPADRKSATAVSIPRDSWVQLPECVRDNGSKIPAHTERFNSAYSEGGAACTIKTVEALTQIRIDHYVVIDFSGFARMVDALGGVNVCLPQAVDDPKAKLRLSAGLHKNINGQTALAYVRARYTLGDGSDIERIGRQQTFLSSVVQKATSTHLLLNPVNLFQFLDAATKSITTDPGLGSLGKMTSLATSLQHVGTREISFITVPNEPYRPNPNVVAWKPQAAQLWDAIRYDRSIPGTPSASPSPTPTVSPLTMAPRNVRVRVLNATGVAGTGSTVAQALRAEGFQVVLVGTAPAVSATTTVERPAAYVQSGRTLAEALGGAPETVTGSSGSSLTLIVGSDYSGVHPVTISSPSASPSPTIVSRSAAQNICS